MAAAPFTIVGKINDSMLYTLANVKVYLRNLYGEELEAVYDLEFDVNGLFSFNASNFDHNPVSQETLTLFAIDTTGTEQTGYRIYYNFLVNFSPQFLQPLTLEPYDTTGPVINNLYFLEGDYTCSVYNHLMMDVEGASSMIFSGNIVAPIERMLFNDRVVIQLSDVNGSKTVLCRFYDEHNNYTDGQVGIFLDTVKPIVTNVVAIDHKNVEITFSEVVRSVDANNKNNYNITGMNIQTVQLQPNNMSVIVTTVDNMFGVRYYMEIRNVRDLAGNIMDDAVAVFDGVPYPGFIWTDEILPETTYIKAIHLNELRTNAITKGVTPPVGGWTDTLVEADVTDIYFEHWNELRERIAITYSDRYGRNISWVSGPLSPGATYLAARHIKELRAVVDAL